MKSSSVCSFVHRHRGGYPGSACTIESTNASLRAGSGVQGWKVYPKVPKSPTDHVRKSPRSKVRPKAASGLAPNPQAQQKHGSDNV